LESSCPVTKTTTTSSPTASAAAALEAITKARKENPKNLMAKHFSQEYFLSLSPLLQTRLLQITKSGADNSDSGVFIVIDFLTLLYRLVVMPSCQRIMKSLLLFLMPSFRNIME
jgi:hypothetical protein